MARGNPYDTALDRNAANYTPLSPLSLIARTAYVHPQHTAVIHGERRLTWLEVYTRCRRLASALRQHGIAPGDTVAAMLPNIPAMVEAHFGIAMAGAVLNALNTRLDADTIAFMLDHGNAKVLFESAVHRPRILGHDCSRAQESETQAAGDRCRRSCL